MKFRDCEYCMVYGTDNKPLSTARVEVDDKGSVSLYFNNAKLKNVRFKAFVDFYDTQQGLIRVWSDLAIRQNTNRTAEPWMADVQLLEIAKVFQRQKDLRVRVNIPLSFITEADEYFTGNIRNISAGGMFLLASRALKEGTVFSFSCRFAKEPGRIHAKALRFKGITNDKYGYGCQFVCLSPEAETNIRKFVFIKQIENQKGPEKRPQWR